MATAVCVEPDSKKTESAASKPLPSGPAALGSIPGAPAGLPLFLQPSASPANTEASTAPPASVTSQPSAADKASGAAHAKEKAAPAPHGDSSPATGAAPAEAPRGDIPRAPATPAQDPDFQLTVGLVRGEATRQKAHDPETKKRQEAEDASALRADEQISQSAKEENTGEMEKIGAKQQDEGRKFSAEKFKEDLKCRISAARPETEGEAKAFAQEPPVKHFEQEFSKNIADEQAVVTGPLDQKATPEPAGGRVEKEQKGIPTLVPPPSPRPVDPRLATPKAKTDQEVSVQHHGDRLETAMQDNRMSDDQLAESREPSFIATLKVKQEAEQKVAEAPGVYRQKEAALLQGAETQTDASLATGLGRLTQASGRAGSQVHGGQTATETKTETRQREIKKSIDDIYKATVDGVKGVLEGMAKAVKDQFAANLKAETEIFNGNVKARISDYYGDWRIDDKLFGPDDVVVEPNGKTRAMTIEEKFGAKPVKRINPEVYDIFVEEKDRFVAAMDSKLDAIAEDVQAGLNLAHFLITMGRLNIATFKSTLKGDELTYANQLEEEVALKFDTLEGTIDDTREDLLQTLADQYTENVTQLETTFNDINDELKKSWIDRAIEFIETVGRTIFQLADLLFTILVKVAHLVWDIIKHPIRFFETLVSGLMQGIGEFVGNIGTYLQEAFWTWITGATPVQNIRLSISSGLESLFDLVMQVLRLGPADLRLIVEKVLGKEFMEVVDKAMSVGEKLIEPVTILLTQGPGAFWQYLQDTLASIIQNSFDRIKESVFFAFIEKALKWVAGFFIPGGGFVKIVKAIFKAFQFVADNLENIRHFFDSVFESMEAATQGSTAGVVSRIVTGLKLGVVLAIDFLAKQLGLDKIVDSVQKIIQSLRRPIVSGIEWVLRKVKPFVMKIMRKLGLGGKEEGDPRTGADHEVGKLVTFRAAGDTHRLFFREIGGQPVLRVASAEQDLLDFLGSQGVRKAFPGDEYGTVVEPAIAQASAVNRNAVQVARIMRRAESLVATPAAAPASGTSPVAEAETADTALEDQEEQLAHLLSEIFKRVGHGSASEKAVLDLRVRAKVVIHIGKGLVANMSGTLTGRKYRISRILEPVEEFITTTNEARDVVWGAEYLTGFEADVSTGERSIRGWEEAVPLYSEVEKMSAQTELVLKDVESNNEFFDQLQTAKRLDTELPLVLKLLGDGPEPFLAERGRIIELRDQFRDLKTYMSGTGTQKPPKLQRLKNAESRSELELVEGPDRDNLPYEVIVPIDELQATISSQYRTGATRGDGSTAYMVYLERAYPAALATPPSWNTDAVPIVGTTLHALKSAEFITAVSKARTDLNAALTGTTLQRLMTRIDQIMTRESQKAQEAIRWNNAPGAPVPAWVEAHLETDLVQMGVSEARLQALGLVPAPVS